MYIALKHVAAYAHIGEHTQPQKQIRKRTAKVKRMPKENPKGAQKGSQCIMVRYWLNMSCLL